MNTSDPLEDAYGSKALIESRQILLQRVVERDSNSSRNQLIWRAYNDRFYASETGHNASFVPWRRFNPALTLRRHWLAIVPNYECICPRRSHFYSSFMVIGLICLVSHSKRRRFVIFCLETFELFAKITYIILQTLLSIADRILELVKYVSLYFVPESSSWWKFHFVVLHFWRQHMKR